MASPKSLILNSPYECPAFHWRDDRGTLVYTVSVAPNDVGRVIGKDGRVISSVRQLVGAAGAKSRFKTVVKVASDN